jgi:hypothetical protein
MLEMSEREKFLFDLQGFLHVKDFLTVDEVKALNDAVDANVVPMEEYEWTGPSQYSGGMSGEYNIRTASDMFNWDQPWCQPFRDLIAHPKLIPYLNSLFGRGWRLEGAPGLIMARKGCGGHGLHGYASRQYDGTRCYVYANGQFRTGMTVIQYQLRDIEEGNGGVAVIPGSHKANFKCPEDMMLYNTDRETVRNVACKAGDLVIFMEATIHGSLPWQADYERRSLLYRYSPKFCSNSKGLYEIKMPEWFDELTEVQRAVLEPPYAGRRPLIEDDAETLVSPHAEPEHHIPRKRHEL